MFVTDTAVVVERLTVFSQAEFLTYDSDDDRNLLEGPGAPADVYLEALDRNFARRGLREVHCDHVYISRAGTPAGLGGERYLEKALKRAGVAVLRPELMSIADQMSTYAGAKHLVFAEGSALHFRQLIGYRAQTVTVLQRRPRSCPGLRPLIARTDGIEYHEVTGGIILGPGQRSTGLPQESRAFAYTDARRLLTALGTAGIDLTGVFDVTSFKAARHADLLQWGRFVGSLGRDPLISAYNVQVSMLALGLSLELAQEVSSMILPEPDFPMLRDASGLLEQATRAKAAEARARSELADARHQLAAARRQAEVVRNSTQYRVGSALLRPAVLARRAVRRTTGR